MHGAKIGYFTGDVRRLTEDIKALQPTLFPAVPRVLGRIYAGVWKKARENYLTRAVLHVAFRFKRLELRRGVVRQDSIWDKLVFKNVRSQMGGKVKLIMTGSAPIEGDVLTFLRVALGIPVSYFSSSLFLGFVMLVFRRFWRDMVRQVCAGPDVNVGSCCASRSC